MKELKALHQKIKDTLLAGGIVKTVQVYANQITRLVTPKNGTGVVPFPAVLVEFSNIDYIQLGNRRQQFTATVRLHTCVYSMLDVGFEAFDVVAAVHRAVDGLETENTTGLLRINDDTDNDFTSLAVTITEYVVRGTVVPEDTLYGAINALDINIEV